MNAVNFYKSNTLCGADSSYNSIIYKFYTLNLQCIGCNLLSKLSKMFADQSALTVDMRMLSNLFCPSVPTTRSLNRRRASYAQISSTWSLDPSLAPAFRSYLSRLRHQFVRSRGVNR